MAINVARGKGRARPDEDLVPAIGGESDIFSCPACARPLAAGTTRCPGCRTRFVMGTQLGRVALFLALGIAIGSLVGGGGVTLAVQGRLAAAATPARPAAVPTAAPAQPNATAATNPDPAVPGVPAAAAASLAQTAVINARLSESGATLGAIVASGKVDTALVAATLRSITSEATSGLDLTGRLDAWAPATDLALDLRAFYADARVASKAGLGYSLSNEPAYLDAARSMVAILGSLGVLDAQARMLADDAGITLVPVAVPASTDAAGPADPGSQPLP